MFNALGSLQPLMLSEIGDMQQVKSGYRLEGFIQTFAYSLTAVVAQVAAIIPAVIQSKMGFNPANYQVPEGSDKFILDQHYVEIAENYGNVALWISVVSSALMLICLIFYDLDKRKHAEIVKQLKASAVNAEEIAQEEGTLHILEKVTDTEEDNLMKELSEEINETDDSATQDTETSADSLEKTDGDSLMEDK